MIDTLPGYPCTVCQVSHAARDDDNSQSCDATDVPRISTPFGDRLEVELDHAGLTQQQFATEVGVSQQTVSKWITGETTPRFRHLPRIEEVLGVAPGTLSPLLFAPRGAPEADHPADRSAALVAGLQRKVSELSADELARVETYVDRIFKHRS